MPETIQAIDFMFYVATPEFIEQWNQAKQGELLCRMEKATNGLPWKESLRQVQELGLKDGGKRLLRDNTVELFGLEKTATEPLMEAVKS
jgi:hypothetical protein